MALIAYSGDARASAFVALGEAKKGNFDRADELMKQATEQFTQAHHYQTDLLVSKAQGDNMKINVLLTSMSAQELIRELIQLYKVKAGK